MPASKLLLGLSLYGYVSKSTRTRLSGSSAPNPPVVVGDSRAHVRRPLKRGKAGPAGDLSGMWGEQIAFGQLLEMGALKNKGDGSYVGVNGYTMGMFLVSSMMLALVLILWSCITLAWDDCSDTPVGILGIVPFSLL